MRVRLSEAGFGVVTGICPTPALGSGAQALISPHKTPPQSPATSGLPGSLEGLGFLVHSGWPGGEGWRFSLVDFASGRAGRMRQGWGAGPPVLLPPNPRAATHLPTPGWESMPVPRQSVLGTCGGHKFTWNRSVASAPAFFASSPPRASPHCLSSSAGTFSPAWGPGTPGTPREALREELD